MRWPDLPLGEAGKWRSGGTPSTTNPDYWGGDIPWISSGSLIGTRLSDSERRLTPEGAANGTSLVDEGAILFVVRGMSLKSEFRVGRSMRRLAFGQDCKAIVVDRAKFQPEFLTYALKALEPVILGMVDEAGHGTGRLDTGLMERLEVPMPDLATQTAIADVLGALDDKIAANEREIHILDNLSHTLTAAVLQLGHRQMLLGDFADVTMGSSPRGESLTEDGAGVPFHQGVRDFGVRQPNNRVFTSAPVRMAQAGDVLISVRAPVGSLNRTETELCIGRGLAAARSVECSGATLFHLLRASPDLWAAHGSDGTVFASISKPQLSNMPLAVPDGLAELDDRLRVLEARVDVLAAESVRLAATRDALLPELMSGRLSVKKS